MTGRCFYSGFRFSLLLLLYRVDVIFGVFLIRYFAFE